MPEDDYGVTNVGHPEQGVLDSEASIWGVLRKSEEKIRIEKKRLNEEKAEVEHLKEQFFKEKDELAGLKDEVIFEKTKTLKERDQLTEFKDQLAAQRQKATRIIGRLEEQQLYLMDRVDEVNQKISEVDERTKMLLEREKALQTTSEEVKVKSNELIKWENEIIEKEKDSVLKTKALIDRENELQDMEKALYVREKAINQAEQERLAREKEMNERGSQFLVKDKAHQEEYEKLLGLRVKLLEKESSLLSRENVLGEGGSFEPIEPISIENKGMDMHKIEEDLGLREEEQTHPEIGPKEDSAVPAAEEPKVGEEAIVAESKSETQYPESEGKVEETEGERACPRCGTMIIKQATTCFACGTDVIPESGISPTESQSSEEEVNNTPSESTVSGFEVEEKDEEIKLPSKEELYTINNEQLVNTCSSLGLDTSGRIKHLRERLLDYMEKTGLDKEKTEGIQTIKDALKEENKTPTCSDCSTEMKYIEKYDRNYCNTCEKYATKN